MSTSKTWIKLSPNLKKGSIIINKLDSKKFLLLLNKIVLELKQDPNIITVFSDEEKEKLKANFSIGDTELQVLVNSCIIILSQALHNFTNPENLKKILMEELLIEEDKAHTFFTVWSNNAKTLILKYKQKSVSSCQLEDVSWLVNIEIASENNLQTFIPKAFLQLKLKEETGSSDIKLELNEKDLYRSPK
ncbi:COMM domain-containing protein 10 isoform X2 [Halyomorpha halys]|uniref:COMM domain-containing protein 10 isoform X2 n=1 Tax=Halyomorpha halys TaxID=286706 RepID=UPI0006D51BA0|nr:COMM domain-containing protein 10-like isoform X2 [Halyomorpha halys]